MADSNEVSVIGLMDCPRVHGCTEALYLGIPPWMRPLLPTYYCSSLCGQWAENLTAMWQGYTEILPSQQFRACWVTHWLHHCCVAWSVTLHHVVTTDRQRGIHQTAEQTYFCWSKKWSSLGPKNYYAMESFVICCSPPSPVGEILPSCSAHAVSGLFCWSPDRQLCCRWSGGCTGCHRGSNDTHKQNK